MLVMGVKIVMSKGMLLEGLGDFFERKVEEGYKIFELFICPWCMNTLFSVVAHVFAFGLYIMPFEFNWQLLIRWPLIICGASFVSGNIWNLYETVNRIRERNEAETEYFEKLNQGDN